MTRWAAVQNRSGVNRDDIKQLIGIPLSDTEFDERIDLHLRAAKHAADRYMCNPFYERDWDTTLYAVDANGDPIPLDVPQQVVEGLMVYVMWHLIRAKSVDDGGGIAGYIDEEVGDVRVRYAGNYATRDDMLRNVQGTYWAPWALTTGM